LRINTDFLPKEITIRAEVFFKLATVVAERNSGTAETCFSRSEVKIAPNTRESGPPPTLVCKGMHVCQASRKSMQEQGEEDKINALVD
jgi:hypothetical protein